MSTQPHTHVPVVTLAAVALFVGLSIATGPVMLALLVMFAPLAVFLMLARSTHRSTHPH